MKWLESLPTIFVALIGFWIVHKLTKRREREKLVLELYRTLGEQISAAAKAAVVAWSAKRGSARKQSIAETKWRVQQVGATAGRLKSLSARRRWRRWLWRNTAITLTANQVAFRRSLTGNDLFEDPRRNADSGMSEMIEQAAGTYQSSLDQELYRWL